MKTQPSQREIRARTIFASPPGGDPADLLQLATGLRDEDNNIEYARRVLVVARKLIADQGIDLRYRILKALAICTYKSPDQPLEDRLTAAYAIVSEFLTQIENATTPQDLARKQDMLGIAGAIYKQRWLAYGLREHLEKSLGFYRSGMALGIQLDRGYTAVNAAFVLELLAAAGADTSGRAGLLADARNIREQIRDTLLAMAAADPGRKEDFWFLTTLGETYLGLRQFQEAETWMAEAGKRRPPPWQLETTARQNATLAGVIAAELKIGPNELTGSAPWSVVRALMGGNAEAALSFILGKVGLALSGGGFRASLFHIGMLARLAELDMLRHVEVISCVSGGSILGAYYYLEVRKKLEQEADQELDRADYIEIVERVQENFLRGVQKNIRLRMLMGFGTNLRVLTSRKSSMTDRLAMLYDRELYDLVKDDFEGKRRSISDIVIHPKDSENFSPKYDNWTRKHKVPVLILNATTVNTCHNWQFTASFMGESPARAGESEINANDRLRRMYYHEAPPQYREPARPDGMIAAQVKLSEAVAASACVPGLFDPLAFDGLYGTKSETQPFDYGTRLVDGGVYDNQGVSSLLEQNCTVLLVSDASGQTGVLLEPGYARIDVVKRTNSILMARVREAQFQYLATLRDARTLRGLMYIHLKKDLEGGSVDWMGSPDRSQQPEHPVLTRYGMRRDVQMLVAGIRTDLDSFSDCEADALMLSGYLMTRCEFGERIRHFPVSSEGQHPWRFRTIASIAANQNETPALDELRRALKIAAEIEGKPFRASRALSAIGAFILVAIVAAAAYACWVLWDTPFHVPAGKTIVIVALSIFGLGVGRRVLRRWVRYRNPFIQLIGSVLMCLVGWMLLRFHLYVIEPFYLRFGPKYRHLPVGGEPDCIRKAAGAD